jgi:cellobiose phosphorylase
VEVIVTSNDNAEIRKLTLKINGADSCYIETTSYFEVVLATRSSDMAHPAFSNLFIRTEYDSERRALLANRRPRGQDDKEMWLAQIPVIDGDLVDEVQFETDRMQFIGRGNTVSHPAILDRDKPLSNTSGAVLDPVMSLRRRVRIYPGETVRLSYITGAAESRESGMELAHKYNDNASIKRTFELAWTRSQVEVRFMGLRSRDIELYQSMISHILFISPLRRMREDVIRKNVKGQSGLWPSTRKAISRPRRRPAG